MSDNFEFDLSKPIVPYATVEVESAPTGKQPRVFVDSSARDIRVFNASFDLSPEHAALREAARTELDRRIAARAKWALDLLEQGETLPAWMSTGVRDDYVLSGTAITIRGGYFDQKLKRWIDVPDLGVDPFANTTEALEREIREMQMEGLVPSFAVRGSWAPNLNVIRRIVERYQCLGDGSSQTSLPI